MLMKAVEIYVSHMYKGETRQWDFTDTGFCARRSRFQPGAQATHLSRVEKVSNGDLICEGTRAAGWSDVRREGGAS